MRTGWRLFNTGDQNRSKAFGWGVRKTPRKRTADRQATATPVLTDHASGKSGAVYVLGEAPRCSPSPRLLPRACESRRKRPSAIQRRLYRNPEGHQFGPRYVDVQRRDNTETA